MSGKYDLVVIGSGPAGEVGAIRASQLGLKVALIEKNEHLGGTCLNVGCIPTKALLESGKVFEKLQHVEEFGFSIGKLEFHWQQIMARKEKIVDQQRKGLRFLMKKNKVDVYAGIGRIASANSIEITDSTGAKTKLETKFTLIATGSKVRELPQFKANHKNILTSDSVLFIDHIPKSMVIVGGGVVGIEFACLFARFGSEITVVELSPQILPYEDHDTVHEMMRLLKKQNIKVLVNSKLTSLLDHGDSVTVNVEGAEPFKVAKVLLSIGREPVTSDIGLDKIGVAPQKGGTLLVDEHYRMPTVSNFYAVGDVINTPALAHTASAEAMHAVEHMADHNPQLINYDANPSAIYSYPEIASIGATEKKLKDKGVEYKVAKFPFAPLAKAKIEMATDGFIKILFDPKFGEILGVHIINAKATELIAEFSLGKVMEGTIDDIGHTIHPHPTLSETIMEAAHTALGGAIHL